MRLLIVLLLLPLCALADDEAEALLQRVRAQHAADTVVSRYRVRITRPDWQREIEMQVIEDRAGDRYQGEVLAPRLQAGTLYLKHAGRLWMVIPKLHRKVGISAAMLSEPWMGSDLSNQDVLQGDAAVDDYVHRVIARDGDRVTLESTPRPDRPALWRRLVQEIRTDGVPVSVTYYDPDDRAVRRIAFDAVERIGERRLPTHWTITPLPERGDVTELRIEQIEFDRPLPADAFAALERATAGTPPAP